VGQSSFSALSHKLAEGQFRVRGRRYLSALPSLPVMRGRKSRFPPHIGPIGAEIGIDRIARGKQPSIPLETRRQVYPRKPEGWFAAVLGSRVLARHAGARSATNPATGNAADGASAAQSDSKPPVGDPPRTAA
jgi:hypothetical protein